uniref:NADH dehydrogenase [ubiquinone] 1 alpha subcomplex subunit 9, mitochondrial-like n=1 Tax=Nicotiana tabacum TaxID=4097 RepID=A0A1S3X8F1_TOBAC|nr:PREDICTED: NADH dehydrogenase [ubiquinone] 1 alpha subcomplex subunit 9, mitochondrial-like [Nicotiana tabacum]
MLILGKDKELIAKLKRDSSKSFDMKNLGPTQQNLGMKIVRERTSRKVWLYQDKYIECVLEHFNMTSTNPISTPLVSHLKLSEKMCSTTSEEKESMARVTYSSAVGSLIYAMVCTRPGITHVVSRFLENHGKEHWEAIKWILRYLRGTVGDYLYFGGSDPILKGYEMLIYGVHYATEAGKEMILLKLFLQELGLHQEEYVVYCDSQSAIDLTKNSIYHARTKHIDVRYYWIREQVKNESLHVKNIHTSENPADMLTKLRYTFFRNFQTAPVSISSSAENKMQAITRKLGHQSLKHSPAISSFKSLYPPSDDHYCGSRFASNVATSGGGHLARKGTGGRSSVSGIVATVFGATGFLGRYVVQELAKMGTQVLVPFRGSEDSPRHLKLMGDLGQIVPMKYNPRDENSVKAVMAKANVVINLIGREYETRNYSFEEVNHHMAEQLAMIAKEHGGIIRFIQVSCLGVSPTSPSRMLRAKAAGEVADLLTHLQVTIMRPAVMIGTEDRILNPWAHFAKKYGFIPLFGDGSTKIQPVFVADVASAIVASLKDNGISMGKVYELGGPDVYTMHELAELMFDMIREWPRYVNVPFPIAKASS